MLISVIHFRENNYKFNSICGTYTLGLMLLGTD